MHYTLKQRESIITTLIEFVTEKSHDTSQMLHDIHSKQYDRTGRSTFVYKSRLYVLPDVLPAKPYKPLDVSIVPQMMEYLRKSEQIKEEVAPLYTFFQNVLARAVTGGDICALLPSVLHAPLASMNITSDSTKTMSEMDLKFFKMNNSKYYDIIHAFELHKILSGE